MSLFKAYLIFDLCGRAESSIAGFDTGWHDLNEVAVYVDNCVAELAAPQKLVQLAGRAW